MAAHSPMLGEAVPPSATVGTSVPIMLVLVGMDYAYGRDVLRGASRYRPKFCSWRVRHGNLQTAADLAPPADLNVIGLIAMVAGASLRAAALGVPYRVVNVSAALADPRVPSVLPDNVAIGRLAAAHLMERGFTRFAFYGGQKAFELERWEGFAEVAGARHPCIRYDVSEFDEERCLRRLTPPTGLMTDNDRRATRVLRAAGSVGLRVPDDLAIIGVDNDELECSIAEPRLSSVDPGAERVGYEAAALLDRMLCGEGAPPQPLRLAPTGVVARESTDVIAVEDGALAGACSFIRAHACDAIQVGDIVKAAGISRRMLEIRFRKHFGRTLHDEVRRVRMQRAAQMLVETDMKILNVATRCGFKDFRRFIRDFSGEQGLPPGKYRKQFRLL